tara:strand:+ start:12748 stop:14268 length:1521 start_codon:yes stop_codon:yes gene_type:complete
MKRNLISIILTLLITFYSKAQTSQDAYNLSSYGIFGSARYTSMGGAFGSLGGDLSSVSDNPAGAAVFLYPEMGISFEVNFNNSIANNDERNIPIKRSFSDLNQFGLMFSLKNSEDGNFKRINFGFNIQKIQEFKNNINSISNRNIGLDQFFLNNANGISLSELTTIDNETIDELYDFLGNNYGYGAQQAFLGYQGFIIDPILNDENNNSYVSSANYDQVNHDFYIDKMGDHKKYSFTLSTQYNESIYLGLNLNSHHINFREVTDLNESNYLSDSNIDFIQFNNDLFTYGKGFSAQIGIIAKVKNNLRLGFSYQTPTRFNLTEESMQFIISDYIIMDSVDELSRSVVDPQILNIYDYKLSTPSKTSFSASMVFGSKGLISAEYSSKNYGNINFISDRNPYLRGLNQELKTNYKNASMFRIGGEIRQKKLSLRAGYYAEESSIKNNDNSHYGSSFGIGYDFKNGSIISLSLVSSNINLVNSLSSSGINDSFTSNTKRNSISMSYNLKL